MSFRRPLIKLKLPILDLSITHTSENVYRDSLILLLERASVASSILEVYRIREGVAWIRSVRSSWTRDIRELARYRLCSPV
jgi:hypothetical protein